MDGHQKVWFGLLFTCILPCYFEVGAMPLDLDYNYDSGMAGEPFCYFDEDDDYIEPIFYPHPSNCSLYYECFQGELTLSKCFADLHFNPTTKECDHPDRAYCFAEDETLEPIFQSAEAKSSVQNLEEQTNYILKATGTTENNGIETEIKTFLLSNEISAQPSGADRHDIEGAGQYEPLQNVVEKSSTRSYVRDVTRHEETSRDSTTPRIITSKDSTQINFENNTQAITESSRLSEDKKKETYSTLETTETQRHTNVNISEDANEANMENKKGEKIQNYNNNLISTLLNARPLLNISNIAKEKNKDFKDGEKVPVSSNSKNSLNKVETQPQLKRDDSQLVNSRSDLLNKENSVNSFNITEMPPIFTGQTMVTSADPGATEDSFFEMTTKNNGMHLPNGENKEITYYFDQTTKETVYEENVFGERQTETFNSTEDPYALKTNIGESQNFNTERSTTLLTATLFNTIAGGRNSPATFSTTTMGTPTPSNESYIHSTILPPESSISKWSREQPESNDTHTNAPVFRDDVVGDSMQNSSPLGAQTSPGSNTIGYSDDITRVSDVFTSTDATYDNSITLHLTPTTQPNPSNYPDEDVTPTNTLRYDSPTFETYVTTDNFNKVNNSSPESIMFSDLNVTTATEGFTDQLDSLANEKRTNTPETSTGGAISKAVNSDKSNFPTNTETTKLANTVESGHFSSMLTTAGISFTTADAEKTVHGVQTSTEEYKMSSTSDNVKTPANKVKLDDSNITHRESYKATSLNSQTTTERSNEALTTVNWSESTVDPGFSFTIEALIDTNLSTGTSKNIKNMTSIDSHEATLDLGFDTKTTTETFFTFAENINTPPEHINAQTVENTDTSTIANIDFSALTKLSYRDFHSVTPVSTSRTDGSEFTFENKEINYEGTTEMFGNRDTIKAEEIRETYGSLNEFDIILETSTSDPTNNAEFNIKTNPSFTNPDHLKTTTTSLPNEMETYPFLVGLGATEDVSNIPTFDDLSVDSFSSSDQATRDTLDGFIEIMSMEQIGNNANDLKFDFAASSIADLYVTTEGYLIESISISDEVEPTSSTHDISSSTDRLFPTELESSASPSSDLPTTEPYIDIDTRIDRMTTLYYPETVTKEEFERNTNDPSTSVLFYSSTSEGLKSFTNSMSETAVSQNIGSTKGKYGTNSEFFASMENKQTTMNNYDNLAPTTETITKPNAELDTVEVADILGRFSGVTIKDWTVGLEPLTAPEGVTEMTPSGSTESSTNDPRFELMTEGPDTFNIGSHYGLTTSISESSTASYSESSSNDSEFEVVYTIEHNTEGIPNRETTTENFIESTSMIFTTSQSKKTKNTDILQKNTNMAKTTEIISTRHTDVITNDPQIEAITSLNLLTDLFDDDSITTMNVNTIESILNSEFAAETTETTGFTDTTTSDPRFEFITSFNPITDFSFDDSSTTISGTTIETILNPEFTTEKYVEPRETYYNKETETMEITSTGFTETITIDPRFEFVTSLDTIKDLTYDDSASTTYHSILNSEFTTENDIEQRDTSNQKETDTTETTAFTDTTTSDPRYEFVGSLNPITDFPFDDSSTTMSGTTIESIMNLEFTTGKYITTRNPSNHIKDEITETTSTGFTETTTNDPRFEVATEKYMETGNTFIHSEIETTEKTGFTDTTTIDPRYEFETSFNPITDFSFVDSSTTMSGTTIGSIMNLEFTTQKYIEPSDTSNNKETETMETTSTSFTETTTFDPRFEFVTSFNPTTDMPFVDSSTTMSGTTIESLMDLEFTTQKQIELKDTSNNKETETVETTSTGFTETTTIDPRFEFVSSVNTITDFTVDDSLTTMSGTTIDSIQNSELTTEKYFETRDPTNHIETEITETTSTGFTETTTNDPRFEVATEKYMETGDTFIHSETETTEKTGFTDTTTIDPRYEFETSFNPITDFSFVDSSTTMSGTTIGSIMNLEFTTQKYIEPSDTSNNKETETMETTSTSFTETTTFDPRFEFVTSFNPTTDMPFVDSSTTMSGTTIESLMDLEFTTQKQIELKDTSNNKETETVETTSTSFTETTTFDPRFEFVSSVNTITEFTVDDSLTTMPGTTIETILNLEFTTEKYIDPRDTFNHEETESTKTTVFTDTTTSDPRFKLEQQRTETTETTSTGFAETTTNDPRFEFVTSVNTVADFTVDDSLTTMSGTTIDSTQNSELTTEKYFETRDPTNHIETETTETTSTGFTETTTNDPRFEFVTSVNTIADFTVDDSSTNMSGTTIDSIQNSELTTEKYFETRDPTNHIETEITETTSTGFTETTSNDPRFEVATEKYMETGDTFIHSETETTETTGFTDTTTSDSRFEFETSFNPITDFSFDDFSTTMSGTTIKSIMNLEFTTQKYMKPSDTSKNKETETLETTSTAFTETTTFDPRFEFFTSFNPTTDFSDDDSSSTISGTTTETILNTEFTTEKHTKPTSNNKATETTETTAFSDTTTNDLRYEFGISLKPTTHFSDDDSSTTLSGTTIEGIMNLEFTTEKYIEPRDTSNNKVTETMETTSTGFTETTTNDPRLEFFTDLNTITDFPDVDSATTISGITIESIIKPEFTTENDVELEGTSNNFESETIETSSSVFTEITTIDPRFEFVTNENTITDFKDDDFSTTMSGTTIESIMNLEFTTEKYMQPRDTSSHNKTEITETTGFTDTTTSDPRFEFVTSFTPITDFSFDDSSTTTSETTTIESILNPEFTTEKYIEPRETFENKESETVETTSTGFTETTTIDPRFEFVTSLNQDPNLEFSTGKYMETSQSPHHQETKTARVTRTSTVITETSTNDPRFEFVTSLNPLDDSSTTMSGTTVESFMKPEFTTENDVELWDTTNNKETETMETTGFTETSTIDPRFEFVTTKDVSYDDSTTIDSILNSEFTKENDIEPRDTFTQKETETTETTEFFNTTSDPRFEFVTSLKPITYFLDDDSTTLGTTIETILNLEVTTEKFIEPIDTFNHKETETTETTLFTETITNDPRFEFVTSLNPINDSATTMSGTTIDSFMKPEFTTENDVELKDTSNNIETETTEATSTKYTDTTTFYPQFEFVSSLNPDLNSEFSTEKYIVTSHSHNHQESESSETTSTGFSDTTTIEIVTSLYPITDITDDHSFTIISETTIESILNPEFNTETNINTSDSPNHKKTETTEMTSTGFTDVNTNDPRFEFVSSLNPNTDDSATTMSGIKIEKTLLPDIATEEYFKISTNDPVPSTTEPITDYTMAESSAFSENYPEITSVDDSFEFSKAGYPEFNLNEVVRATTEKYVESISTLNTAPQMEYALNTGEAFNLEKSTGDMSLDDGTKTTEMTFTTFNGADANDPRFDFETIITPDVSKDDSLTTIYSLSDSEMTASSIINSEMTTTGYNEISTKNPRFEPLATFEPENEIKTTIKIMNESTTVSDNQESEIIPKDIERSISTEYFIVDDEIEAYNDEITNMETSPDCTNKTFIPHECSAVHFYRCVNGKKIKMRCPDGLFYDAENSICDWPPRGSCQVYFTDDCTPTSVYFPDRDDPKSFYQCANGAFYKFKCPSELVFNTQLNVCDWPKDVRGRNCSDGNCEPNAFTVSPLERNGWVPVVGARPVLDEETTSNTLIRGWNRPKDGSSYPSMVKWPNNEWQTQSNVLTAVEDAMESENPRERKNDQTNNNEQTWRRNGTYYLLTANSSDSSIRQPSGWLVTRPWYPPEKNVISLSDNKKVEVSVDLSVGVLSISNNLTDFTVNFKPNEDYEEGIVNTNVLINKEKSGVVTIRAGIRAMEDHANVTVKVKGG